LEGLPLTLESTIVADLCDQRSIPNLTERLVHAVMPHIVSMKEPKNVGCDGRRGNVHIMNGLSVDLAMVSRAI
jgi:hypothetical protein